MRPSRPNRRRPAVRAVALHRTPSFPVIDREWLLAGVAVLLLAVVLLVP